MNGTKAELIKNKHTWIQSRLCDKNVWNQLTQSCICHAKSQGPREWMSFTPGQGKGEKNESINQKPWDCEPSEGGTPFFSFSNSSRCVKYSNLWVLEPCRAVVNPCVTTTVVQNCDTAAIKHRCVDFIDGASFTASVAQNKRATKDSWWWPGGGRAMTKTGGRRVKLTCRLQVVGIGVVAKHRIKVNVKALRVLGLLGCRGGWKPWRQREQSASGVTEVSSYPPKVPLVGFYLW